jgi:hypothetical protein
VKKPALLFLFLVPLVAFAQSSPGSGEVQFVNSLEAIPSAAGLYALADELGEKGDLNRARQALRSLMRRFPDSALVERAADRLANMPAVSAAGSPANVPAAAGKPGAAIVTANGAGSATVAAPVAAPVAADPVVALFERCGLGVAEGSSASQDMRTTYKIEVTNWTGDCLNGKRSGRGELSIKTRATSTHSALQGWVFVSVQSYVSKGTIVDGRQTGLWCASRIRTETTDPDVSWRKNAAGDTVAIYTEGKGSTVVLDVDLDFGASCWIGEALPHRSLPSHQFRRDTDGRWQLAVGLEKERALAVYLPAGSLETMSDRLITDARAGRKSSPTTLEAWSPLLTGLAEGERLPLIPVRAPLDLKSQRVAIVMSAGTLAELTRFRQMRQALIDAPAIKGEVLESRRAGFIEGSNPELLLQSLASGLLKRVKSVVVADDLSVLESGTVDYALIFDWRFEGRFDLSGNEFDALPVCAADAKGAACAVLFNEKASMMLVNSNAEIVRAGPIFSYIAVNKTASTDKGIGGLMATMRNTLGGHWGKDQGIGSHVLEQEERDEILLRSR